MFKRIQTYCFLVLVFTLSACGQDKRPILGDTDFQRDLNETFKDATKSPLKEKDRKNFGGLDFFKFDSTYVVTATLERTPNEKVFKMKTTTDRRPEYSKFGVARFELNGKQHELAVYENREYETLKGYEDPLFIPFLDDTNGDESYGGGRYLNVDIPEGNTLIIDFNTAYNPYCAYNEKYSCPIVPRDNYVQTEVRAGVKAWVKK